MIHLNSIKEDLKLRIGEIEKQILSNSQKLKELEIDLNSRCDKIEAKYLEILNQIKTIYDEYNSKIISGQIFTEEILNSVVSAFKSGFVEFFPKYFSQSEVADRVREVERTIQTN